MVGQVEERIANEVKRGETHVIRALKESGRAVFDYISEDAVFAIDGRILDAESQPTLKEYLKDYYIPHATFEMKDIRIVATGLMAATTVYTAKATRIVNKNEPPKRYNLICSSGWRQMANAEWELVSRCEGKA